MIPFNKISTVGKELDYIQDVLRRGRASAGGYYTKQCEYILEKKYSIKKALLTSSCSSALEICAILLDLKPGDEVIVPSFSFVTTANAFELHGAKIIMADINPKTLNMDPDEIESLITDYTKAIVVVHYAGVPAKMDEFKSLSKKHNITLIEDAALGFNSFYENKALGTIGDLGTYSFHETKNITCGEGGALVINNDKFIKRAQLIRDKGTNRNDFEDNKVDKYEWIDLGSSYVMSEISAAYLLAQLEEIESISDRRIELWHRYKNQLSQLELDGKLNLPFVPGNSSINGSMFFLLCHDQSERNRLIAHLKNDRIKAVFHYTPLHTSPYFQDKHDGRVLPVTDTYCQSLLRLPLYTSLSDQEQTQIIQSVRDFYG